MLFDCGVLHLFYSFYMHFSVSQMLLQVSPFFLSIISLVLQITGLTFSSVDPDFIYVQGVDYEVNVYVIIYPIEFADVSRAFVMDVPC